MVKEKHFLYFGILTFWLLFLFGGMLTGNMLVYFFNNRETRAAAWSEDVFIVWDPVCRHNALYWTSMVGENHPVRIVWGTLWDEPHVQPQIKLGDSWYYFYVKDDRVIIAQHLFTNFKVNKYYTFKQYADIQNNWLKTYAVELDQGLLQ